MFTEMLTGLEKGVLPDSVLLRKRFDVAMTKKLGVVKLPPAFWMQDPKINPRADHLLWAALLLGNRDCVEMARTVIAAELAEQKTNTEGASIDDLDRVVHTCAEQLLDLVSGHGPLIRQIHALLDTIS